MPARLLRSPGGKENALRFQNKPGRGLASNVEREANLYL